MRRRRYLLLVLVVALGAAALPLWAQQPAGAGDAVQYSLADCLRIALQNNLDLVIARKDPEIAAQQIEVQDGRFDGVFGASANYNDQTNSSTITDNVGGASTDGDLNATNWDASGSWSQLLNFGGTYSVTLNAIGNDRTSRSINQFTGLLTDASLNADEQGLALHYEMPLLANFGKEATTLELLLARSGLDVSKQDLRLQAMQSMKSVEDAYWDLMAVRAALQVARESLKLAQDLLDLNKKKVEVGTLAPIEITQAEAGVASREEGVIVAEAGVKNAEDNLRRLLAIPKDDPAWSREILPTDRPQFEKQPADEAAALTAAMENRPEMAMARQQLKDTELSERVAKNQTRHSLTLSADLAPGQSTDKYRQTNFPPTIPPTDTTTDADGRTWAVGLLYGYPLGNRQAKANYAIATLNREKSDLALQNTEQSIRVDVRTAVRSVESGGKRVDAAHSNTILQRKTLEAEQKKFDNGMSTSFEVLRIQTDLSNAQLSEIRAILDYNKALADLERAKGTLLEARGLKLE